MTGQRHDIIESVACSLLLTSEQAIALRSIGKRLVHPSSKNVEDSEKTLIECSTNDGVNWRVRVSNAVGVIGLPGGARIAVHPKIPMEHLVFLLRRGGAVPRSVRSPVGTSESADLQDLIAAWFLTALETLIRGGLRRAYVLQQDRLAVVRGRINVPQTTVDVARGQLRLSCEYEELTEDTPLNRVLAAAAQRVARSRLMPPLLRRRARNATYHLAGLTPMSPVDLTVHVDRSEAKYSDAIALAKLVLAAEGVGLETGEHPGSSFLLPTPLVVEEALRQLVAEALAPAVSVTKGRLGLGDTQMTVNPDLDFAGLAVGDVKYKIWDGSWIRADLYQLLAFAVAYETTAALHVGFGGTAPEHPLRVGDITVWRVAWNADKAMAPEDVASTLQDHVRGWWAEMQDQQASVQGKSSEQDRPSTRGSLTTGPVFEAGARDTALEAALAQSLLELGYRFTLAYPVPGKESRAIDIAFPSEKVAIFVDGCFSRRRPEHGAPPRGNENENTGQAVTDNGSDEYTCRLLEAAGWTVLRFWQHEEPTASLAKVRAVLSNAVRRENS